jgi:hypothetical protein
LRKRLESSGGGFSDRDLRELGRTSSNLSIGDPRSRITSTQRNCYRFCESAERSGDRAADCAVVHLGFLGATTGTERRSSPRWAGPTDGGAAVGGELAITHERHASTGRRTRMGNRCARLEKLSSGADDGYSERLRSFPATFRHFRKPLGDFRGPIWFHKIDHSEISGRRRSTRHRRHARSRAGSSRCQPDERAISRAASSPLMSTPVAGIGKVRLTCPTEARAVLRQRTVPRLRSENRERVQRRSRAARNAER